MKQRLAMRLFVFVMMTLFLATWAKAQESSEVVSGQIVDKDGYGYFGATIVLKSDPGKGTATDLDGNFSLKVPAGADITLKISAIGMRTEEVAIGTSRPKNIEVEMSEDVQMTEEVVVTGFRTEQKRDINSSIASIDNEAIEKTVAPSFEVALQGRSPGVQVTQGSGMPGGAINIRVRGTGSISAGSEPLYIIDGVPVVSGNANTGGSGGIGANYGYEINPLADINPEDIESIEVLKDASATAIYGARGSNGVVLITTKRGKKGQTRFTVGYKYGIVNETNRVKLLNGPQYLEVAERAVMNSQRSLSVNTDDQNPTEANQAVIVPNPEFESIYPYGPIIFDSAINDYRPAVSYNYNEVTNNMNNQTYDNRLDDGDGLSNNYNNDWVDNLFRTGVVQQADLNVSGGTERTQFYVGTTYRTEKGILRGNQFDRLSTRFNLDNEATDKLKVGLTMMFSYTDNQIVPTSGGGGVGGGFGVAQSSALPIFPVYNLDPDQTYFNPFGGTNIVANADQDLQDINRKIYRTTGNVYVNYNFNPHLTFRTELGLDYFNQVDRTYFSRFIRLTNNQPTAQASDSRVVFNGVNINNILTWTGYIDKLFTGKDSAQTEEGAFPTGNHHLTVLLGNQFNQTVTTNNRALSENFPNDYVTQVSLGEIPADLKANAGGNYQRYAFLSYFTQINYKYLDRYQFGLSVRAEGSSRFGAENRWGYFPAMNAGWIISDEKFFPWDQDKVSFAKLRASFGYTGNARIPNDLMYTVWGSNQDYLNYPGLVPRRVGDPNIRWERSSQLDVGIQTGFMRDRFNFEMAYFVKNTVDMLLAFDLPMSSGIPLQRFENAGALRNYGWEFNLKSKNIIDPMNDQAFRWETEFNISILRNKVLDLGGLEPSQVAGNLYVRTYVDQPLGTYYLPKTAGLDNLGRELIYGPFENIINNSGQVEVVYQNAELHRTNYDQWVREVYNNPSSWTPYRPSDNNLSRARVEIDSSFQPNFDKRTIPDFYGGLTNNFSWRNWSLSVLLTYQYGNYILDLGEFTQSYVTRNATNLRAEALEWDREIDYNDNYDPANDNATIPVGDVELFTDGNGNPINPGNAGDPTLIMNAPMSQRPSDRFLHDASYIRLKNVMLRYDVPRERLKKLGLNALSFSLSMQNLYTLTNFPGWDPEVLTAMNSAQERNLASGITRFDMPQVRTIMFGVQAKF